MAKPTYHPQSNLSLNEDCFGAINVKKMALLLSPSRLAIAKLR
ncbi:MAG: hypothetical protein WBA93_30740 [Microcoleaceae cyanobacterium]